MQKRVLNIARQIKEEGSVETHLTFNGFINFLKERSLHEKTRKGKYLEFVIAAFEARLPKGNGYLKVEEMAEYEDLLQLMYSTIFPPVEDESQHLWALSAPLDPVIFYGSDAFYGLLTDKATGQLKASMVRESGNAPKEINLGFLYAFVLKKLYNYTFYPGHRMVHAYRDEATGVSKFYRLNVDTRFLEVYPKGALPVINFESLHLHEPGAIDFLLKHLPLQLFRFEGISSITLKDTTVDYVVENIKNIILSHTTYEKESYYPDLVRSLKILAGNDDIDFGLLPFLKVNEKPVFSDHSCSKSLLAGTVRQYGGSETAFLSMVGKYYQHPEQLFFESVTEANVKKYALLKMLQHKGVKAYSLLPVFYNNKPAGVLEVYSKKEGVLTNEILSRLDVAVPLLAQLLQQNIDDFEIRIDAVIKENFTSLQPSVEWKFNEAAWNFLKTTKGGKDKAEIENIYFKNVYPLYGAIDIRNSTIERNNVLRRDMQAQFDSLLQVLPDLRQGDKVLVDRLLLRSEEWLKILSGSLTTAEEIDLSDFLENEIRSFFLQFKDARPDKSAVIDVYLEALEESAGAFFKNRRELESSIQLINTTINNELESASGELQKVYPSYFEKFRTDGVEYDIYTGQSIAPERRFELLYLRQLRLWQLHSMAKIAKLTHSLLPRMPGKLQTTQLIFVHSNPIDISFRKDEKRFDVEGSYNIRYQIIKKRVDKVHIRGGEERLTQPGRIAIIYFNEKEGEEYRGYVKYLQEKNILNDDLEQLELEELQGVSGLKALRVGVGL